MRVLFLVQYPETAPSPRYRVYQMIPWLEANGVNCHVVPMIGTQDFVRSRATGDLFWKSKLMWRAFRNRMRIASRASEYDLVYVLKGAFLYGPPIIERKIRRQQVPMIFDFDDAIHIHKKSTFNPLLDMFRSTERVPETIRMVDQIVVPNSYLADYSRQFTDKVTVVAEAEDTDKFTMRQKHQNSDRIVIGWVGSPSTAKYLKLITPALQRVCQLYPHAVVRVVGGTYEAEGVRTETIPWSLENEVSLFQALDIGIMPLPLEEWSKGKSGCKLRQYMASGVPGVATSIGYNCELVENGKTGFLVTEQEEWVEALSKLIQSAVMRQSIADAARQSVVERFSIPGIGPQLKQVFERTIQSFPRKISPPA
jgi:glycosyltransferase involved in cell wall biosynthesis